MLLQVDADRLERGEVEVEHVVRGRLQEHLVLVVLLEAERVLAVASVRGADRRLDVARSSTASGRAQRRNVAGLKVPAPTSVWYGCMSTQPWSAQ